MNTASSLKQLCVVHQLYTASNAQFSKQHVAEMVCRLLSNFIHVHPEPDAGGSESGGEVLSVHPKACGKLVSLNVCTGLRAMFRFIAPCTLKASGS